MAGPVLTVSACEEFDVLRRVCNRCRMKAFAISDRGISRRSLNEYRLGDLYDGRVKQNAGWHLSYYMSISGNLALVQSLEGQLSCRLAVALAQSLAFL